MTRVQAHINNIFSVAALRAVSCFIPAVLLLVSCKNDPEKIKMLTSKRAINIDKGEGIMGIYSTRGNVKARLFADHYIKNSGAHPPYTAMNGHFKVEYYNDSGVIQQILTADSCRYYENEGNVIVWGNVVVLTTKGEKMTTEELVWNRSAEKIFSEKRVHISTGTEVLEGTGFEANQDFSWYQILHPNGAVQVNKGEME